MKIPLKIEFSKQAELELETQIAYYDNLLMVPKMVGDFFLGMPRWNFGN